MNTEYLKEQLDNIMIFRNTYKTSSTEDKYLHNELSKVVRVVKDKIWNEEHDSRNRHRLKTKIIDGVEIVIPEFMNGLGEEYQYKLIDSDLYVIPTNYKEDKDGSFHQWAYAYIKENENKHTRLTVSVLGNDKYGDRIFTEAEFHKKVESDFRYSSKNYGKNDRFPEKFRKQVEIIIAEYNKLDGVNNFNPLN
ncbi:MULTISPECIES: hypothetical protein [Lysinibacillus]|uniref:hypothetical protein n=1 Tax=Lysinibacillus TaxID=400634 RepID=UPI00214CE488|nr:MULTISPECIES: hypothetical protein [Lysinibacillus]UUV25961.1 hypothetical protein NP781_04895 [Lysinibacillus sp. FN11]UYB48834.1 hypothetical protein OCI51_07685 [Lysinibacillus capsici]